MITNNKNDTYSMIFLILIVVYTKRSFNLVDISI